MLSGALCAIFGKKISCTLENVVQSFPSALSSIMYLDVSSTQYLHKFPAGSLYFMIRSLEMLDTKQQPHFF